MQLTKAKEQESVDARLGIPLGGGAGAEGIFQCCEPSGAGSYVTYSNTCWHSVREEWRGNGEESSV